LLSPIKVHDYIQLQSFVDLLVITVQVTVEHERK